MTIAVIGFDGILAIPMATAGPPRVPTHSIDLEKDSTQYLSMSDANFGSYDHDKFAVSFWYKRESTGVNQYVCLKGVAGSTATWEFGILFNSANRIDFQTYSDASSVPNGRLLTSAAFNDTENFHHVYLIFDVNNATAGDRMRLWHDGVEVTSFAADTHPTASTQDAGGDMQISRPSSQCFDGLINQWSFFSGTHPDISNLLYPSGSPRGVASLGGIYSSLDVLGGDVTHDAILTTAWTNNNTAVASSAIPS